MKPDAPDEGSGAAAAAPTFRSDLLAALPAWIAARVVVGLTVVAAHYAWHRLDLRHAWIKRHLDQGILGWDAERYLQIAADGYAALPRRELRFFPLLPLVTRGLGFLTRLPAGLVLLVIVNVAALVFGALVHRLVLHETADARTAWRATWLVALAPPAFVLAWGYSEALWGCFAVATFIGLRSGQWWVAAAAAFGAGLTRPVGVLLALPAVIETVRDLRARHGASPRDLAARAAAVVAAPLGTAVYLAWVWQRFGDALLPFRIQQSGAFRRSFVNPVTNLSESAEWLLRGNVTGDALHVPWALLLIGLTVITFRRWPASYGAFAAAILTAALVADRLGSFERYGFAAFPILLTVAVLARQEAVERAVLVGSASAMGIYGTLALLGGYTP